MAGAQDVFPWCRRFDLLYLAAKLSLMDGDVEGLWCQQHRPTNYS
jgi:hypothetical protein